MNEKTKRKIFAEGICFEKLFIIFLIASVIGSLYEQILNLLLVYSRTGQLVWEYRRGVIYGPFNVIYGFGAVLFICLLANKKHKWYETVIYGSLLGGGIEYIIGFLQETFTQTISWNYSHKLLNINGRITLEYMILWGFLALILVKYFYPFVSKLIEKIPYHLGTILTRILLIFMVINMLISWGAILRQTLRRNNVPAITPIGEFFDKNYDDDFLKKYFPNMIHSGGE